MYRCYAYLAVSNMCLNQAGAHTLSEEEMDGITAVKVKVDVKVKDPPNSTVPKMKWESLKKLVQCAQESKQN